MLTAAQIHRLESALASSEAGAARREAMLTDSLASLSSRLAAHQVCAAGGRDPGRHRAVAVRHTPSMARG